MADVKTLTINNQTYNIKDAVARQSLSNVVTTNTNQTISGVKTLTNGMNLSNVSVTKGTAPASTAFWSIRANDNVNSSTWQNSRLGVLEWMLGTDNKMTCSLVAYKNAEGSPNCAIINVVYDTENSKGWAEAPSPDADDSSNKIATTSWVKNIVDNKVYYHPDLFAVQWSDHIINDMSWLRADNFSWQSGITYAQAYQHLLNDISGKSLQTENVGGVNINFYLADDGHKICPANQENALNSLYNNVNVAWFYIIDTTNQRFKLPRTKFGFTGLRDQVGKYVSAGLPNITATNGTNISDSGTPTGAFKRGSRVAGNGSGGGTQFAMSFDASLSNPVYGNSTTVQPRSTQMYLYFYVGNFTQDALENTAGLNASLFNNKADINLLNIANNIDFVIESQRPTAENNWTWYRKYKSGWVEQGGYYSNNTSGVFTVNIPVTMSNASYTVTATLRSNSVSGSGGSWVNANALNQSQIQLVQDYATTWVGWGSYWRVEGFAA